MTLEDSLKQSALNYITDDLRIDLIFTINNQNRAHLNYLIDSNIISEDELENALKSAVLRQARRDYDLIISEDGKRNGIYPDTLAMPECLSYAIENNEFTFISNDWYNNRK